VTTSSMCTVFEDPMTYVGLNGARSVPASQCPPGGRVNWTVNLPSTGERRCQPVICSAHPDWCHTAEVARRQNERFNLKSDNASISLSGWCFVSRTVETNLRVPSALNGSDTVAGYDRLCVDIGSSGSSGSSPK